MIRIRTFRAVVAVAVGCALAAVAWAHGDHETPHSRVGASDHEAAGPVEPVEAWRGEAEVSPFQDIHFAACPCWLTSKELLDEISLIHSDISFDCDVSQGLSAVEIKVFSSGVGGPFRSFVHTAQSRAVGDSRCRHVQTQPSVEIPASAGLRSPSERDACSRIVSQAAKQLQCSGFELLR